MRISVTLNTQNKFKNCYLHLGLHKTASSSFQHTCAKNLDLLRSFDITYPIFSCSQANKVNIINHSSPIRSLFDKHPSNYQVNIKWKVSEQIDEINNSYLNQLEGFLENSNNIILSGEGMSTLHKDGLNKLVEKIKSFNYKVKILALVRSPYAMYCSGLQTSIKSGSYSNLISLNETLPNSVDNNRALRSNTIKKLKLLFKESIQFYNFKDACNHKYGPVGFLIDNFLKIDSSLFQYIKKNESLFNLTIRLQNEQNKINPVFLDKKLNPKHISLKHLNDNFNFSGKFLLTKKEFKKIEEIIYRENKKILKLTGINFKDEIIEFSKPIFCK